MFNTMKKHEFCTSKGRNFAQMLITCIDAPVKNVGSKSETKQKIKNYPAPGMSSKRVKKTVPMSVA